MKTFRGLLKKKLIELNYPVEISKFCANGRIRCLGRYIISKNGIRIIRRSYPEYSNKRSGRYYEDIFINRNNYIDKIELENIIDELKECYGNNRLLRVYIYD